MKRFTETDKWRDSWFRKLKPLSKLAFIYVLDNCDAAGVWDPDYELADFTIGEEIPWPMVLEEFGDRVKTLSNGKWYLTRFIEFQYGDLVEDCRPHARVLALLGVHGIPYAKGIGTVSIPKRTGQYNTIQEGGAGGGEGGPEVVSAETIYEAYPRKEARQDALRAITKAMKRCPPAKLLAATQAYRAEVSTWISEDRKYVPYPATWFNGERYNEDPALWTRSAPQPIVHVSPEPSNLRSTA